MIRPAQSLLTLWAATSIPASTHAFTSPARPSSRVVASTTTSSTILNLQDPPAGTKIVSNKKEVAWDGTRFYETGVDEEDCIPNQEFCIVDPETSQPIRLTVQEKERMFLDSLQSYYVSGRQVMDDAEFDALKEDLSWNGSEVVNLNRKEITYLEAMQSYMKGEPMISDTEFDTLRDELKEEKSIVAVSVEPKCYIDTGVCKVTFQKDVFRNNLLYLPVGSILALLWLGIGFELIGGRINPLVLGLFGAPIIISGAKAITDNFIFSNNLVAYGPCPSCESENRIFFGDILGIEGFGKQGNFKCKKCKAEIVVQRRSLRASTLPK